MLDSLEALTTYSVYRTTIYTLNEWLELSVDPPECAARFGLAPRVAIWVSLDGIAVCVWFGIRGVFWCEYGCVLVGF